ncbi:DUF4494 domain-containing protein [Fulvivirgaceae bacterium BMA12]|uniref:DUF4494 domain-containing protein n=1 Tax=Agaribacillus aureus TaxID=3051825 RepID=A0ABT8L1T7_9BACT|nr:DUF4494 domain-containing protein [Fulvivirgaceae bacterium BMA12]
MRIWFVCKAKYQKENDQGIVKEVTEPYLVDAFTYTEAESRIYELLENMISGSFIVTQISKTNINDVFYFEGFDIWYKCKIVYQVDDGDSGKEKKVTNYMLVSAENVKDAYDKLQQSLSNMLVTYNITSIIESPILEVFPFSAEDDETSNEIPANLKPLSEVDQ